MNSTLLNSTMLAALFRWSSSPSSSPSSSASSSPSSSPSTSPSTRSPPPSPQRFEPYSHSDPLPPTPHAVPIAIASSPRPSAHWSPSPAYHWPGAASAYLSDEDLLSSPEDLLPQDDCCAAPSYHGARRRAPPSQPILPVDVIPLAPAPAPAPRLHSDRQLPLARRSKASRRRRARELGLPMEAIPESPESGYSDSEASEPRSRDY